MRLLEISVHGLLKRFSYPITLHTSERITIIHGPNGYGKTTLLKLINSFYAGAYDEVMSIPFEQLELIFEGGVRLVLTKRIAITAETEQGDSATKPTLLCEMYSGKTQVHSDRLKAAERMHRMVNSSDLFRRFLPFLDRIGPSTWLDARTGESLERAEVFARFADVLPAVRRNLQ